LFSVTRRAGRIAKHEIYILVLISCLVFPTFLLVSKPVSAQYVKEVKYLVALFEFEDLNHTKSFEEVKRIAVDQVQTYYDEVSYGKVKVKGDILPGWRKLPYAVKHLDLFRWTFTYGAMDMIDNAALSQIGQFLEAREYAIKFIVYAGKVWGHAKSSVKAAFMNEYHSAGVYGHELGHVLGLPDLYSYKKAEEGKYSGVNVGPWDLMSESALVELSAWSKVKLGWIEKPQIVDLKEESEGVFVIDAISNKTAKIMVLRIFRVGPVQGYYVEVRERLGVGANMDKRARMGVLVFRVDETADPREGGVTLIDSHPNSYRSSTAWAELYDAPFSVGRNETVAFINREKNLSIIVLAKIGYSYKIKVSAAATGDRAIEANSIIVQAEDAIAKAEGESRLKGLDNAKSQLSKANAAYSESRFEEAIVAARSAIEQANAATTMPTTTVATTTPKATTTETAVPSYPTLRDDALLISAVAMATVAIAVGVFFVLRRSKKREPQTSATV